LKPQALDRLANSGFYFDRFTSGEEIEIGGRLVDERVEIDGWMPVEARGAGEEAFCNDSDRTIYLYKDIKKNTNKK
jgi:hypothetical protein